MKGGICLHSNLLYVGKYEGKFVYMLFRVEMPVNISMVPIAYIAKDQNDQILRHSVSRFTTIYIAMLRW